MSDPIVIKAPLDDKVISKLKAGDAILIEGSIFTARDSAHQKLAELIKKKAKLPFNPKGNIVFYAGPTPSKNSLVGSIGPTTASRMDPFTEPLLKLGLKGMIGKGPRSKEVKGMMKKYKAIYFVATGGAAALYAQTVKKAEMIAFPELGPEAILKLEVKLFPAIVAYDISGKDLFEIGQKKYRS